MSARVSLSVWNNGRAALNRGGISKKCKEASLCIKISGIAQRLHANSGSSGGWYSCMIKWVEGVGDVNVHVDLSRLLCGPELLLNATVISESRLIW
jgi:hypothetical protein